MRIALAQINTSVGDLKGNARKIVKFTQRAQRHKADFVVFPELAITGYPPEDLLLKRSFIADNILVLRNLAGKVGNITAIIGFVDGKKGDLYNSAAIISKRKIRGIAHKILLPNYGVFDEKRYFNPGTKPFVFSLQRSDLCKLGVNICEDIWHDEGPAVSQAKSGAKLIFTLNASPYHAGKIKEREAVVRRQAKKNRVWVCYVNLVGGQDELVFDGQSLVISPTGKVVARAGAFEEEMMVVEIDILNSKLKTLNSKQIPNAKFQIPNTKPLPLIEEIYQALVLGLRDYVRKNGFKKVVIGLSGGIDSSLTAVLAADALGSKNVIGVSMPSPFTSKISKEDAKLLASNLGIRFLTVPIGGMFKKYLETLRPQFKGSKTGVAEENLQARIRGNILMGFSNKFGWLVLTTGNKSETSVGYATLYGDAAGGFAPIKDVPKTMVYKLAEWRNKKKVTIPKRAMTRPPSAELRPGQKDTDSLPPYNVLDPILRAYVEEDRGVKEIVGMGFPENIVRKIAAMVDRNEYKRRQAPPGIKITPKSFGRDRRMPITNRYKQ